MIQIDADFESGNIGAWHVKDEGEIEFEIRLDTFSDHYQWFYFRVRGAAGKRIRFRALNAGGASYAEGWKFHRPVIGENQQDWKRIEETDYDGEVYSFTAEIFSDPVYFAYYYPLTTADLDRFLQSLVDSPALERRVLTQSLGGRPVHWLQIAEPDALAPVRHSVWVIGRQHPGEPQGTSCAMGLISMLLSDEPLARDLRKKCVFQIVPDINPDGVAIGNHRTNPRGVNLNRAWKDERPKDAPSIHGFQEEVRKWKAAGRPFDFFFDMHSDEIQRSNVVYAMDGTITDENYQRRQLRLLELWQEEDDDFSATQSSFYPGLDPRLARQWMFLETGAISFTWEMTYHDAPYSSGGDAYIDPPRTFELGCALGRALGRFWK